MAAASLPYHEPSPLTLIILTSFLILHNALSSLLDHFLHCGLIAQIGLGILFGTPGLSWLSQDQESVIVNLGYIGLILLVYEGGLATDFKALRSNVGISIAVALTGIAIPIVLTFILMRLIDATPVQTFAAGAALCSTNLGTTFSVLRSSGLASTRLGTVLATAAMLDDIVGLIMVKVIEEIGGGKVMAITVIRPVGVSVAFLLSFVLGARYVLLPLLSSVSRHKWSGKSGRIVPQLRSVRVVWIIYTLFLLGVVIGASYAGTSNLFAAYLAGACITWIDDRISEHEYDNDSPSKSTAKRPVATAGTVITDEQKSDSTRPLDFQPENSLSVPVDGILSMGCIPAFSHRRAIGKVVFERYYAAALGLILKPFFFASIGFAIPITQMFTGPTVWKGVVYSGLMAIAKLVTGIWLLRIPCMGPSKFVHLRSLITHRVRQFLSTSDRTARTGSSVNVPAPVTNETIKSSTDPPSASVQDGAPQVVADRPLSLYPASILGLAMVARGEIGYLIASLAESKGVFKQEIGSGKSSGSSQIYLIVVWAITVCTIIGPISVGVLVKRVKRLHRIRPVNDVRSDPLDLWGFT